MINQLILLYISLWLSVYWHELGHFGRKIRFVINPLIPLMYSDGSRLILGGLLFNVVSFLGIYLIKPTNIFILYIGLTSWIHFLSYTLIEPLFGIRTRLVGQFSDIRYKDWKWFVIGIIIFFLLKGFYLPVLLQVFS